MRQAATEVDMEITSIQPPKLTGDSKPLTSGDPAAEEILEAQEVPVTIDAETSKD